MNRHYKTLELDKILEKLAAQTSLSDAREMALSLEPQTDIKKVHILLKQTDDAVMLSGRSARLPSEEPSTARHICGVPRRAAVSVQRSFCA